jgi:hypothetical protein
MGLDGEERAQADEEGGLMSDTRFWNATEQAESDFAGRADVSEFRRRMRKLGHGTEAIRDQVESIHPELLDAFDRTTRKK